MLLVACLLLGGPLLSAPQARAEERKAIQFQFTDLDGHPVRLADFRGKWVLVNFWAYWCPMSHIGIPTLNALNQRDDFVVIGISMDYGDSIAEVRDAIEEFGMHYDAQVAGGSRRDPNSAYLQVGPVDDFPTSYLYDPTGEIVMFIPGQIRKNEVLAYMDNWRTQKAGTPPKPAYAMDLGRFEAALTGRFGAAGANAYRQWRALREGLATATAADKLTGVNDFFNRHVHHMSDKQAWGRSDYWATPAETLGSGRGDSGDIAIAKYFTLLSVDIPVERLRLVYTRLGGEIGKHLNPVHIVLAYYATSSSDPLLLDDLVPEVKPASQRPELKPVFSFNSQNIFIQPEASAYNQPAWQGTLQRARAEGFE
jgi:predicted transglutaminase-like cysteine proteinase